jgi:hypothetical protein
MSVSREEKLNFWRRKMLGRTFKDLLVNHQLKSHWKELMKIVIRGDNKQWSN